MKTIIPLVVVALIVVPVFVGIAGSSGANTGITPSVVLVRGAWADGFRWGRVVARVQVVEAQMLSSPFKDYALPGRVEAEDFDIGGEGVAYHDLTPGNAGGVYRTDVDVDIRASANAGGYEVFNFDTGEWLQYTVRVPEAGTYRLEILASSEQTTGRVHVEVDGVALASVPVPTTGSWTTYQWFTVAESVQLASGAHVVRVVADGAYFGFAAWQAVALASPPPPADAPSAGNIYAPEAVSTTSIQGTATGYGVVLTPRRSGTFLCIGAPVVSNDTPGNGVGWWLFYSKDGILPKGTVVFEGGNGKTIAAAAMANAYGNTIPLTGVGIVSGLPLGVPVYFQIGIAVIRGGVATLSPGFGPGAVDPIAVIGEL